MKEVNIWKKERQEWGRVGCGVWGSGGVRKMISHFHLPVSNDEKSDPHTNYSIVHSGILSLQREFQRPPFQTLCRPGGSKDVCGAEECRLASGTDIEGPLFRAGLTVFGQEHDLMGVKSHADLVKRVPVRDYEGPRPWFDRVKNGEPDILWPGNHSTSPRPPAPRLEPSIFPSPRRPCPITSLLPGMPIELYPRDRKDRLHRR